MSAAHCLARQPPTVCWLSPPRSPFSIPLLTLLFLAVDVCRKWDSEHGAHQQQWHCRMCGCRHPNTQKTVTSLLISLQPLTLLNCFHVQCPVFIFCLVCFVLPQILIIFISIKKTKHFNTPKLMFVHSVWSPSCWCAVSLGEFPLTTISCFSPFFSPLCAASALTGKSTLLLFTSKPQRAAWLRLSRQRMFTKIAS